MFKSTSLILLLTCMSLLSAENFYPDKPMLSITIDDPNVDSAIIMGWQEKDDAILNTLEKFNLQAALFVCGKRIDNEYGKELLEKWNSGNHLICNHSYSHSYFHSAKITLQNFIDDYLKCDLLINKYKKMLRII